jgi:hypothetical protein
MRIKTMANAVTPIGLIFLGLRTHLSSWRMTDSLSAPVVDNMDIHRRNAATSVTQEFPYNPEIMLFYQQAVGERTLEKFERESAAKPAETS